MGTLTWAICTSLEFLELFHKKKFHFWIFPSLWKSYLTLKKTWGNIFSLFAIDFWKNVLWFPCLLRIESKASQGVNSLLQIPVVLDFTSWYDSQKEIYLHIIPSKKINSTENIRTELQNNVDIICKF